MPESKRTPSHRSTPDIADVLAGRPAAEIYGNRELGVLAFVRRVLAQASDPDMPLLERVRFLAISSLVLDEFFEVRYAGLKEQIDLGIARADADGLRPLELLSLLREEAAKIIKSQYDVLERELIPALAAEDIVILTRDGWSETVRRWARRYFRDEILPVLTPVGLDPAHPFPLIVNKSLNFIVGLTGRDAFGRASRLAVVQAPRILPRIVRVPDIAARGKNRFVTLSALIRNQVGDIFPGMRVKQCAPFRVTRDSELWVDEEEVDDLLRALEGELTSRHFGRAVRLEVNEECDKETTAFLMQQFHVEEGDLFRVQGMVNLNRLSALHELVDRDDLRFRPFTPRRPARLAEGSDVLDVVRENDVLLHHPFDSFGPVIEFLEQAADDPAVLAIKMTLYRSGAKSSVTDALLRAARAGKEVAVVVELRARFDEETNIDIAHRLQAAGAKVVYGVVGYKAHAKMILVVRREEDGLRRYVHLGTGNYHPQTSKSYTDWGLLTADPALGADAHSLFQQLTGLGKVTAFERILQSPFSLLEALLARIAFEADQARAGRPSGIRAKVNALTDVAIIDALYAASHAGVPIDLVVRGVCNLRPGIPGISATIRVRSIVGRFLEHSRIYNFHAAGANEVWLSSADWMPRNLRSRVEMAFPIDDPKLAARVIDKGLTPYLEDDRQAWELGAKGNWTRVVPGATPRGAAQQRLLADLRAD